MKILMFSLLMAISFINIPEASANTYLQCMINANKKFRPAKTILNQIKNKEVTRCRRTPMGIMKRVSCLLKVDTVHKAEVRVLETKKSADFKECKNEFGR